VPTRPTNLKLLIGAAVLPLALPLTLVSPAWSSPSPPPPEPSTLCAPAGVLRGADGQRASVSLCAGSGTPTMAVSAPATCQAPGSAEVHACLTSGTWTARKGGVTAVSGKLPGSGEYPGPGKYDVEADVHVKSSPAGVDLRGTVRATLTLTAPKPPATHRIEVDRDTLQRGAATTLTYRIFRDSEQGDGSARFGLIGEENSGVQLSTSDARCVNPLTGRYPATTRNAYALDCAVTDLQPGHPATVVVRASVGSACSTVVSKLGYWMPQGQALYTGGMLAGPTVGCA